VSVILRTYFIDEEVANNIENAMLHSFDFPWFIGANTDTSGRNALTPQNEIIENEEMAPTLCVQGIEEATQLTHMFVADSEQNSGSLTILNDMLNASRLQGFYKIKANLLLKSAGDVDKHHTPHVDQAWDHFTAIYYVNDSDGDTFFFDNEGKIMERETPKKGKIIIFSGDTFHASSTPRQTLVRSVININARAWLN
jgi:hypothetical protein